MEYKEAIPILRNLPDKYPLDAAEKEAVTTAIGVLVWGSLAESRLKAKKAKKDKSAEW